MPPTLSLLLFAITLSHPLYAETQPSEIKVAVEFFPVGSFTITSTTVQGTGRKVGATFTATELSVPVSSLDTGIKLRTTHMQEKLKASQYPLITAKQISAQNGSGKAVLTIMHSSRPITFTYQDLGNQRAQATFKLTLSDFELRGINYRGVGVQDEVEVTVTMPYQLSPSP